MLDLGGSVFISDEVARERLKDSESLLGPAKPWTMPSSMEIMLPPAPEVLEIVEVPDEPVEKAEENKTSLSEGESGHENDPTLALLKSLPELLSNDELPNLSQSPSRAKRVLDNLLNGYAGRGTKSLHRDVQASIGTTAAILGTTKASRLGDVAVSSAASYENGYTGPVDMVAHRNLKRDLQDKIIRKSDEVVDVVFGRLLKTLSLMTDDKLMAVGKATELSLIARNLNGIISASTPKEAIVQEQSVHFHVWRPEMAEEAEYPVIEVNSEKEEKVFTERAIATGA